MSEMVLEGVVQKKGQNKAKYWNVKIEDEWYSLGKDTPKFEEGDTIRFTYTKNNQWNNGDPKSVELVAKHAIAPAAKASGGKSSGGEDWGARADYWDKKDKRDVVNQLEHRYRFALATAKDIVLAALDRDVIKLSEAKKKDASYDSLKVLIFGAAEELYNNIDEFMAENAVEEDAKFALPDEGDMD